MDADQLQEVIRRLNRFVEQQMERDRTPSVVLALTDRESTLHTGFHGYANLDARIPPDASTLYETGSIGKSFTAICLLQLEDEGLIDLHVPVTTYLPWFEIQSDFEPFTIHHLLSHTSGMINGSDFAPDPRYEVWALRETSVSHPPGEHFHYSNVGYKLLGLILEAVEGKPYAEIVAERILEPLGLAGTSAVVTDSLRPSMAVGYTHLHQFAPVGRKDPLMPATWFQTNTADGCLAAPIGDLTAYLRLFMSVAAGGRSGVLSRENYALMTAPITSRNPENPDEHYGYGLAATMLNGERAIGHSGGMVGYYSDMRFLTDSGYGVAVMINGPGNPGACTTYALSLLQAVARGEEFPEEPPSKPPLNVEDYIGFFAGAAGEIRLGVNGDGLRAEINGTWADLEPYGQDRFFVDHPRYRQHLIEVGRDDEGQVVELFHGNNWYRHERYAGPLSFPGEAALAGLVGMYRSHNPWEGQIQVYARKGQLKVGLHRRDLLRRQEDGSWAWENLPERIRFDAFVDGKALRMDISGHHYYRFFTGDDWS